MTFFRKYFVSTCTVALLLLTWEASVRIWAISPKLLPAPSVVYIEAMHSSGYLLQHTMVTVAEASAGFAIGLLLALGLGLGMFYSETLEKIGRPIIVVSQVVPKMALAPLLIVWVGYGLESKIIVAASISFFPLLENFLVGLRSPSRDYVELFESLGANRLETLLKLRLPMAAPVIIIAAKISALYAIVGAIGAELFSAQAGLGYVLMVAEGQLNTALLFAAILFASGMGAVAWVGMSLLETMGRNIYHLPVKEKALGYGI